MADRAKETGVVLAELCHQPPFKKSLHNYYYLHGLVTAVAASPEIPMPEQWMSWVFKIPQSRLKAAEQDALAHALMTTLQQQLKCMTDKSRLMPNEEAFSDSAFQHVDAQLPLQSPISQWCSGLLAGHSQLENIWLNAWESMLDQEPNQVTVRQKQLKHVLSMLSTFANVSLALEQAEKKGNLALKENLAVIARSLPKALEEYVDLSGSLVSYIENQFETFTKPV